MEKSFAQLLKHVWRLGDLTLFEALMGGAFDCLNRQCSRKFDQNFSKKSNTPGFAWGGDGRFWNRLVHNTGIFHRKFLNYHHLSSHLRAYNRPT